MLSLVIQRGIGLGGDGFYRDTKEYGVIILGPKFVFDRGLLMFAGRRVDCSSGKKSRLTCFYFYMLLESLLRILLRFSCRAAAHKTRLCKAVPTVLATGITLLGPGSMQGILCLI